MEIQFEQNSSSSRKRKEASEMSEKSQLSHGMSEGDYCA
jgi:hypothetical protein